MGSPAVVIEPSCETPVQSSTRPLLAAEVTAINAGRRLFRSSALSAEATVNTVLCLTGELQPAEEAALAEIGDRSFGICARAGVLYQQAADLLADLHQP